MKKECSMSRRYLVRYYLGDLDSRLAEAMDKHLKDCRRCQRELQILKSVVLTAEEMRQDLIKEAETVDWEAFSQRVGQKVREIEFSKDYPQRLPEKRFFQPWRLAIAAAGAGLLGGLAIAFLLIRPAIGPQRASYQVSSSFLERVDEEVARRAILDYLEKSRMILLSLRQSGEQPEQAGFILPPQEKLRQLLNEKKYLSPQLETFRLTKARAILDEIEALLLELALIQDGSSSQETKQISRLIEERRLLLKIQLLRQELEESEGKT